MEDQDYILFEAYLSEELSKEEISTFETRLKTDSEFNEAFTTYKELSSYLAHKIENEDASNSFQKNLENISTTYFNKTTSVSEVKSKSKVFQFYKYAVAACVALMFGVFTFNQFTNPSYDDFNDYDAISLTVRGESGDLLKTAENTFNAKDFAKAEEVFSKLLKQDNTNSELKLYNAIANIELSKFIEADDLLEDLRKGNSAFKNKATWYLALSKLKQENNEACVDILKTLPEDADNYKQAQKLLRKLE